MLRIIPITYHANYVSYQLPVPLTVTSLTLFYDVTNPSTVTSLTRHYDVTTGILRINRQIPQILDFDIRQ